MVENIPNGGGPFLLTGKDCTPQHWHNEFDLRNGKGFSPGYVKIKTANESVSLWLTPGSPRYAHFSQNEKVVIYRCLEWMKFRIPHRLFSLVMVRFRIRG